MKSIFSFLRFVSTRSALRIKSLVTKPPYNPDLFLADDVHLLKIASSKFSDTKFFFYASAKTFLLRNENWKMCRSFFGFLLFFLIMMMNLLTTREVKMKTQRILITLVGKKQSWSEKRIPNRITPS